MNILKQLRQIDEDLAKLQANLEDGLSVSGEEEFQAKQVEKIRKKVDKVSKDTSKAGNKAGDADIMIHGTGTGDQ